MIILAKKVKLIHKPFRFQFKLFLNKHEIEWLLAQPL